MADPKLLVEINGEAGGLFSILAKVTEKLEGIQQASNSSADAARKSMGLLEQGAKAAAQALKLAEAEMAGIQAKLRAGGGSGPDPAAAMGRLLAAQSANASMQSQLHAAQQAQSQATVMSWMRQASSTDSATQALHAHGQAAARVDQQTQSMSGSLFRAGAALMALRAILDGVRQVLGGALDANLALERAQRTLQMATGDGAHGMAFLRSIAQELGLELVTLADGYAMMAASAKGTTMEGKATEQVFRSVVRASTALSLSRDQTHGVILALSQMMSKGKVMAEELRKQLGEHLPGANSIAARALGVTTEELNKMLVAGEVLSEDFLPKFAKELDRTLGDAPEKAAQSLQGNINRIKTAVQVLSYEVGQGGAGSSLSKALGDVANAMNSPEGIAAAKEMSQTMGTILSVGKDVALMLWDLRRPVVALASAWIAMKVGEIVKGIYDWGAAKVVVAQQSVVARQAIIQEAVAMAGLTLTKEQDAKAEVARALAIIAARKATLENAVATGAMTLAEAEATAASIALAEAKLAEAAAMTAAGRAGAASSGLMAVMGGPVGIAIAVVGALAAAYSLLGNEADEAKKKQDEAIQSARKAGDSLRKTRELRDEYNEISKALEEGRVKADGMTYANDRLKAIQNQLILQHPELKGMLEDATKSWADQRVAIDAATDSEERNLKLKRARLETELKSADAKVAASSAEAASVRSLPANQRTGYDEASNSIVDITEDMVAAAQVPGKIAQAEAESIRAQMAVIDDIFKAVDASSVISKKLESSETTHLISQAEVQARLAAIRASSEEKITLEQQKQHALSEIEKQYLEERAKLIKEAGSEEGKWFGKQAELQEVWNANEKRRTDRTEQVVRDYASKREKMEEDLQAKLTAQEEGGLEKRLEGVRKQFVAIREENAKLAQEGKTPVSEETIQAAEDAARARARTEQIKQDLGRLKTELAELAQMKGGPLTSGEMAEAMDRFARSSETGAAAVNKLRAELHLGGTASQGFLAGMESALVTLQNRYETYKNIAISVVNQIGSAWANFFTSITTRGMTAAQKWDALWKSMANAVKNALGQIIAEKIKEWIVDKAISAWKSADSQKKNAENLTNTATNTTEAASGIFSAHSGIPWVGVAIAIAMIALMMNTMSSITGRKVGGLVGEDGPEFTVLGEEGLEVVAPEHDFKHWAKSLVGMGANMQANLAQRQAAITAYDSQAYGFAQGAASALQNRGGGGPGATTVIYQQHGPVMDTSDRGLDNLGNFVIKAVQTAAARRGQVIDTSQMFGARL